jgi:hypothetical protein
MNLNPVGWASAALRLLARLDSDGVNSITPVTEINGGAISATNADIALVAKGTGATLAQVPDGTLLGGNKRGTYATDLQKIRDVAAQIASANGSVISGGQGNLASGQWSVIGGGLGNTVSNTSATISGGTSNSASGNTATIAGGGANQASSSYSFIGGGQSNVTQTNTHATVCGGSSNTASGQYSFVGGGQNNTASNSWCGSLSGIANVASGIYSAIAGGSSSVASATNSFVGGGDNNRANGISSCISGGANGTARLIAGYHVFPACSAPIATTQGCTQSGLLLLARQTTDATATVLTSNSSPANTTNQVILPINSAYSFSGEVIAGVTGAGNTARWTINGAIKRGGSQASTAMVGTATVTMTHFDAGAATWVVAVTADTTNGGIKVEVTGAAATTIRWVCKINTTEMTY